jgi:hypothetical protein
MTQGQSTERRGATSQQQGQVGQDRPETTGQAGRVTLSSEQRTRIRETILSRNDAPRVSNVNFNVAVGTRVPESVRLVVLPETIVEIRPEWRGYWYFVMGDEIVIVGRDHSIVAILDV